MEADTGIDALKHVGKHRHPARVLSIASALCALAFVVRLVLAAGTATIYVKASSACTTGCGAPGNEWKTITLGITDGNNRIVAGTNTGAIIQVAACNYPERIFLYPNIHV